MEQIDWKEAPKGTTHFVVGGHGQTPWRKVAWGKVYDWRDGLWYDRGVNLATYLRVNADLLVAKPVEAALPHGLKWPEGYDYYNPHVALGFFFNEERYLWEGRIVTFSDRTFDFWKVRPDTIRRYNEGVEVAAQPAPKKKVGWWG